MGIYASRKSCWERRKEGLPQDNAAKQVIGEVVGDNKVVKNPVVEEPVVEEPVVEVEKVSSAKKVSKTKPAKKVDKED
jgi:hypothetical protein